MHTIQKRKLNPTNDEMSVDVKRKRVNETYNVLKMIHGSQACDRKQIPDDPALIGCFETILQKTNPKSLAGYILKTCRIGEVVSELAVSHWVWSFEISEENYGRSLHMYYSYYVSDIVW